MVSEIVLEAVCTTVVLKLFLPRHIFDHFEIYAAHKELSKTIIFMKRQIKRFQKTFMG
jgi:hypothetical protein